MKPELAKEILEKTQNDFDRIAPDFSRTRRYLWPELVNLFRGYAKDNDRVLDIGCGNGRLLDLYVGMRVDYVGIDNSVGQIEEAIKRHPDKVFLKADALDLPFPDNSFDKVFSIAVLHEIPSLEFRERFLQEANRVLKPGGLCFLTVWDLRDRTFLTLKYSFLKLIKRSGLDWNDIFIPRKNKTRRYYHVFSKKEICQLVQRTGLEIIEAGIISRKDRSKDNFYLISRKP